MKRMSLLKNAVLILGIMAGFASCAEKEAKLKLENGVSLGVVSVPESNFCIAKTEITQDFYQSVLGENPSFAKGDKLPVESVSWYDSLVFCNKLSLLMNKTPCYKVNGSTNPSDWGYVPHSGGSI